MSSYEQKYKKALKSIQEIIKANKQIKDQLDALRTMRQADLDSFANIQKEEFRKAYDALLKEKNSLAITNQTLQLENEKLKYSISELQNQVALYRSQRNEKYARDDRETLQSNQDHSPRKSDNRDASALLREKEAEFHRTLENYQEHHQNLQRNNKRLEERIGELETKLSNCDKNWRIKYQSKEMEVIDIKAQARQEFTDQLTHLRKENAALKLANSELALRLENIDHGQTVSGSAAEWQGELLQEMIAVRASMEPLRQQVCQLQELNLYEREQSVRERTSLQTRVLELQAESERLQQTLRNMEKKAIEAHQERAVLQEKAEQLKRCEEENQLLNGRIIVMQSREIALRNRTGQELEERVLEFQNRIQLLLSNKEGLRQLREVEIHQLLALKAYIMQLDSRLKELLLNNGYLLKKYKSYKEKYQASLKEQKQLGLTINTLKMKILGYDKLVLKLQGELQRYVRLNETDANPIPNPKALEDSSQVEIYRRKYELMKEKLEVQEKYKEQEMETFKLSYETRIMELTIKVEETRSLKETIELYRNKNEELQALLSRKETELFESKILTNSKAVIDYEPLVNNKHSKDIISQLHASIKQSDETIFRLQAELRTKEDTHKRTISRLEREVEELKQDHARQLSKREMDYAIALDQEVKKYKLKISDLEHAQLLQALTHKDEHHKKNEQSGDKVRKLETRLQEAESRREEEVFNRRRIEKQLLDLTHDREEAQRTINDLQLKLSQFKSQEKDYFQLKNRTVIPSQPRDSLDYELQSKDAIIKRLNSQILELKNSLGGLGERDITISSQKNQIYYLKKEVQELNDTINKYNNQIIFLKGTLDSNKTALSSEVTTLLEDRESSLARLRRDIATRDNRIRELEEEASRLEETLRKCRRELSEVDRLRQEVEGLKLQLQEKDKLMERLRQSESGWDEQVQRLGKELAFVKESFQKVSYQLLEKDDQISKLGLQLNAASLRTREQLESQYSEQLMEKQRQCSRLNSELLSLRSTLAIAQDDRNYHEQTAKRISSEFQAIRSQLSQIQEQRDDLENQLYYKNQEISKLQFTIQGLRQQEDEAAQRSEETYRMRTEIFSLKSDISNLQEDVFNREANNARLANEISYVRNQHAELEQELANKEKLLNKFTYEYNALKESHEDAAAVIEERERVAAKANAELLSAKNKYRELQEEMEERQQAFSMLNQEVARLKTNLTYYQEQIDERNTQLARAANEKELLKAQIIRLNEVITEKNQEVNRAKQQVFTMRLEAGERDYEEKMRIDQEVYTLKSKISALEHEIEDKDSEVRRLQIELDAVRSQPLPQSGTFEEEVQELRTQLGKRQRDLINMRFDLQDRQYQLETSTNNANMLRNTLNEYQQRLVQERQQYDADIKEYINRERKWQEQINTLQTELQQKTYQTTTTVKPVSFGASYTEEEVAALREQATLKQRELNSIKYELEDKLFLLESMESKTKMQETLLRQIEEQYNQDRQRYEAQIQKYTSQERLYQRKIQQVQEQYEQKIARIQYEKLELTKASVNLNTTYNNNINTNTNHKFDEEALIGPYINEIDRLNQIIQQQQYQLESLAIRIKQLQQEGVLIHTQTLQQQQTIGQNTIQNIVRREQHQTQTIETTQQVHVNQQTQQEQHEEEGQRSEQQESASSENDEAAGEQKQAIDNGIKGSLIQQLQKEQSFSEGSQVRGGQITIKIQNAQQYVTTGPPTPVYSQRIIQVQPQPQFIQGPNGQPIRVIQQIQQVQHVQQMQQVPQQVFVLPQQPTPYPAQGVIIQGGQASQSAVYPAAVPQPTVPLARNYISMAAPVSVQPYRSLP